MELRFNLFWAVIQFAGALAFLSLPLLIFLDKNPGQDPISISLWILAGVAFPAGGLGYFGIRGFRRSVQLRIAEEGLSGPLISKDGKVMEWSSISSTTYTNRGFLETLKIVKSDNSKIVIRDLSQLGPSSLLEVFEAMQTKLQTGVLVVPKKNHWWQSTWFTVIGVIILSVIMIVVVKSWQGQ
jgi:hypothetical protein